MLELTKEMINVIEEIINKNDEVVLKKGKNAIVIERKRIVTKKVVPTGE